MQIIFNQIPPILPLIFQPLNDQAYYVEDFDTELPVEEKKLLLKALA